MEIISISDMKMGELFDHYFAASAPFEPSGEKKKEFPDAVALMSLEAWAKANDLRLLAISKDRGWINYAKNSTHIDVQEDLASALSTFQEQQIQARDFVSGLVAAAIDGRAHTFRVAVEQALIETVQELELAAEARSNEEFSYDRVDLEVLNTKLTDHAGATFITVVRTGTSRIVFTVLTTVTVLAKATFTFSGWDDDHGKYDYEDSYLESEDWFEAELLIDLNIAGSFPEIAKIELIHPPQEIDFGRIESSAYYDAGRS